MDRKSSTVKFIIETKAREEARRFAEEVDRKKEEVRRFSEKETNWEDAEQVKNLVDETISWAVGEVRRLAKKVTSREPEIREARRFTEEVDRKEEEVRRLAEKITSWGNAEQVKRLVEETINWAVEEVRRLAEEVDRKEGEVIQPEKNILQLQTISGILLLVWFFVVLGCHFALRRKAPFQKNLNTSTLADRRKERADNGIPPSCFIVYAHYDEKGHRNVNTIRNLIRDLEAKGITVKFDQGLHFPKEGLRAHSESYINPDHEEAVDFVIVALSKQLALKANNPMTLVYDELFIVNKRLKNYGSEGIILIQLDALTKDELQNVFSDIFKTQKQTLHTAKNCLILDDFATHDGYKQGFYKLYAALEGKSAKEPHVPPINVSIPLIESQNHIRYDAWNNFAPNTSINTEPVIAEGNSETDRYLQENLKIRMEKFEDAVIESSERLQESKNTLNEWKQLLEISNDQLVRAKKKSAKDFFNSEDWVQKKAENYSLIEHNYQDAEANYTNLAEHHQLLEKHYREIQQQFDDVAQQQILQPPASSPSWVESSNKEQEFSQHPTF